MFFGSIEMAQLKSCQKSCELWLEEERKKQAILNPFQPKFKVR